MNLDNVKIDTSLHRLTINSQNSGNSENSGVYYHTGLYGKFKELIGLDVKATVNGETVYVSKSSLIKHISSHNEDRVLKKTFSLMLASINLKEKINNNEVVQDAFTCLYEKFDGTQESLSKYFFNESSNWNPTGTLTAGGANIIKNFSYSLMSSIPDCNTDEEKLKCLNFFITLKNVYMRALMLEKFGFHHGDKDTSYQYHMRTSSKVEEFERDRIFTNGGYCEISSSSSHAGFCKMMLNVYMEKSGEANNLPCLDSEQNILDSVREKLLDQTLLGSYLSAAKSNLSRISTEENEPGINKILAKFALEVMDLLVAEYKIQMNSLRTEHIAERFKGKKNEDKFKEKINQTRILIDNQLEQSENQLKELVYIAKSLTNKSYLEDTLLDVQNSNWNDGYELQESPVIQTVGATWVDASTYSPL